MSIFILGAGLAGLGAGRQLHDSKRDFKILEASSSPGGLAQTDIVSDFVFERAGHLLHFRQSNIERHFRGLGIELVGFKRRAAILLKGREVPYPFQFNLWALDPATRQETLSDLRHAQASRLPPARSLGDVMLQSWGLTMTDLFFRPYLEKLWARGLEELPPDSLGSYHPSVNIALVEKGCKEPVESSDHNASFFYPQSGRLGDVTLALAASLGGRVRYSWPVSSVDLERRYCTGPKGTIVRFQEMISTVPLPNLLSMAGIRLEDDRLLASTEVANVRVGFRGKMRCPYHVVYVPDAHLPFHRVFFPYNVNLRTCPEGCASLSIEYTLPQRGRRLAAGELANTAMGYLNKLGLIEMEKCLTVSELVLSPAYVVYRSEGRKEFAELKQKLKRRGVYLAGRYGMWDYMSMEESFKSGLAAAMRLPLAA